MTTDAIEILEERDDVKRSEYTKYKDGENITVELWHDTEGLRAIFQKAIDGLVSPHGLHNYAEEQALAIRETRVDYRIEMDTLYPEVVEQFEEDAED